MGYPNREAKARTPKGLLRSKLRSWPRDHRLSRELGCRRGSDGPQPDHSKVYCHQREQGCSTSPNQPTSWRERKNLPCQHRRCWEGTRKVERCLELNQMICYKLNGKLTKLLYLRTNKCNVNKNYKIKHFFKSKIKIVQHRQGVCLTFVPLFHHIFLSHFIASPRLGIYFRILNLIFKSSLLLWFGVASSSRGPIHWCIFYLWCFRRFFYRTFRILLDQLISYDRSGYSKKALWKQMGSQSHNRNQKLESWWLSALNRQTKLQFPATPQKRALLLHFGPLLGLSPFWQRDGLWVSERRSFFLVGLIIKLQELLT